MMHHTIQSQYNPAVLERNGRMNLEVKIIAASFEPEFEAIINQKTNVVYVVNVRDNIVYIITQTAAFVLIII
jgi:hypothetical protein